MKKKQDFVFTGFLLILISAILFSIHYIVFKDMKTLFFYVGLDIAFIPLELFVATYVVDHLFQKRENEHILEKLNMLIGLFYAELGNGLMHFFAEADPKIDALKTRLNPDGHWKEEQFMTAKKLLQDYTYTVQIDSINFIHLRDLIAGHKELLVLLLSNASLLEKACFSDTLFSVFHINEELLLREIHEDKHLMNKEDVVHLKMDIERAYKNMALEWTDYILHLKNKYPYLYVTACRANPFMG